MIPCPLITQVYNAVILAPRSVVMPKAFISSHSLYYYGVPFSLPSSFLPSSPPASAAYSIWSRPPKGEVLGGSKLSPICAFPEQDYATQIAHVSLPEGHHRGVTRSYYSPALPFQLLRITRSTEQLIEWENPGNAWSPLLWHFALTSSSWT